MSRDGAGKVITFYSYKGGTGRSMALANVAWVLAAHGKQVICIDWDLEAPGLHRYFAPFLIDPDLYSTPGVIDFVWSVSRAAVTPAHDATASSDSPENRQPAPQRAKLSELGDISDYIVRLDWGFPKGGVLDLLPAGQQGATYAERVNAMDWDHFYERLGGGKVINAMRDQLKRSYDYVLIDSRTGVSDTSGICTVQLPDALVVLFTMNKQSMRGADAVAQSVREQRPELPIFPVPTRVDPFENFKLTAALQKAQLTFAPFVEHLEDTRRLKRGAREEYWGDIEFPYVPYFSYEEVLAPFADQRGRKSTLLSAATRLTHYVTGERVSEPAQLSEKVRDQYLNEYAHSPAVAGAPVEPAGSREARPRQRASLLGLGTFLAVVAVTGLFLLRDRLTSPTRGEMLTALGSSSVSHSRKVALLRRLYTQSRELEGVDLSGLDFSGAQLTGINLRSANLRNTRFVNAVLDSAVLSGANLRGAVLTNARLVSADLTGAAIAGADLSGANLFDSDLTATALDSATTTVLTVLRDSTMGPYHADEDVEVAATGSAPIDSLTVGFVWLGNYNRARGGWEKPRLADAADQPVTVDPSLLPVQKSYRVLGDLTVRERLPPNDREYFSSVVSLGWVPRGSTVTLLDPPTPFQRPNRVQYWARVRVDRPINRFEQRSVRAASPEEAGSP